MKTIFYIKNTFLLCFVALLVTSCESISKSISSLGSLCIIACGFIVAYVVYNAFHKDETEGVNPTIGTILAIIVGLGGMALAFELPEDIAGNVGITALIAGVIILIIYLIGKKKNE